MAKKKEVASEEKQDYPDILKEVYSCFESGKNNIMNNCYLGANGSGDWIPLWDQYEKMADGWSVDPDADNWESNVKSPMSSGRIESTMQKLRKLNLGFNVTPIDTDDPSAKRRSKALQALVTSLVRRKNIKQQLMVWFKDSLIHGPAFMQIYYLTKTRDTKISPKSSKELTEEQKDDVRKGKDVYIPYQKVDYNDIAFEPCKLQEMFWDPSARYLHGESYEAQWIIRRMLPSLEQFKALYENDPDIKNFADVKPMSSYTDEEREFFQAPKDFTENEYVQVLHYYNKAKDRYVVVANGVVIKDTPLPYDHKMLPFVMINTYEKPHFMIGSGIPAKLKSIQSEEELQRNMNNDRLHISINPQILVKEGIYGSFSKAYQRSVPGQMLPVKNDGDVRVLEYPSVSYDLFKSIDYINRDAVIATGIDPAQMGVAEKYVSATTSMLTKEQMDAFIAALMDQFTPALNIAGYMILHLMKQFYTVDMIHGLVGKEKKGRLLILEDMKINPKTFEIEKIKNDYSYFQIKPEYFDLEGDWQVSIQAESLEVPSKGLNAQKAQTAIAQLAPFFVDPANQQQMATHPAPYITGPGTVDWYLEQIGLPADLAVNVIEDEDLTIARATEQGKAILKGELIPGIPGESDNHKRVHVKQLMGINQENAKARSSVEQLGPMTRQFIGMFPDLQALKMRESVAVHLAEHLRADDMPKIAIEQNVIQQAQPPQPMNVPMPPGLNMGGTGEPSQPSPMGPNPMNQDMGMNIQPAQTQEGPGRPPMAAQQGS